MGTLSLLCPLCCNESFSSRDSLKEHIHEVLSNVSCPSCLVSFENVFDLTEHLNTDCETTISAANIKKELSQRSQESDFQSVDNEQNDSAELESLTTKNEDGITYLCAVCDVQFKSIEEHLEKFHAGEELVLETEEEVSEENGTGNSIEADETEFHGFPSEETFQLSNDPIDNDQLNKAEEEQQYIDTEEKRIVKSGMVKPNKSWHPRRATKAPITENYHVENGKVKKITEEEAAEIRDRNSIIQIHQCPSCSLQFPKLEHYVQHKCSPKKAAKKKCVHCSATFQSHQSLSAHIKTHFDNHSGETPHKVITLGPHTCDLCNTMFPSFKSLRLHKRMHEPQKNKPIESPVRQQTDDSEENLRQMFVCHICNNTYDIEYEEVHMKSHSDEDNFYCATCNRKFLTKENLEMHIKAHTNSKKFVCSYCKKAFTNFKALNDHVSNHCIKRSYECQYCGRRFSRPCEKVKHERIHTGEKPHICQICGKSFRVSYCLTLHMRTHSGSRPYECPHCKKRFKSHSVYNHHLLIHSDVRAYKCPYCPKAFKTSVQLAGHKNSHIKPFSCTECNRPFASLYAVRAHMETHKRENNLKFDCWLCGATYARAFALKDHMKTQHAGENIQDEIIVGIDETEGNENETYTVEEVEEVEEVSSDHQMQVEEVV